MAMAKTRLQTTPVPTLQGYSVTISTEPYGAGAGAGGKAYARVRPSSVFPVRFAVTAHQHARNKQTPVTDRELHLNGQETNLLRARHTIGGVGKFRVGVAICLPHTPNKEGETK